MDFKHKDGYGSIFKNSYKEKDNQPDYKGNGTTLSGKDVEIAAWVKTAKDGQKYLSLKWEEKQQEETKKKTPEPVVAEQNDLPF